MLNRSGSLLRALLVVLCLIPAAGAYAESNFVPVRLPRGVSVELPKNWETLSNNRRITLDTFVEAKIDLAGLGSAGSDFPFAANYFDDRGKTAALFNIRYYPDLAVNQVDSRALTPADVKEIDDVLQKDLAKGLSLAGSRLLEWRGTQKRSLNGFVALVSEYRNIAPRSGITFRVRLVRVLNAEKSFTVTISYREDEEMFLRPICDRVIQSIRI